MNTKNKTEISSSDLLPGTAPGGTGQAGEETDRLARSRTEGRDGVQRIVDGLNESAAKIRSKIETYVITPDNVGMSINLGDAAKYLEKMSKEVAALSTESPTESEAEGVEECPLCYQEWYEGVEDDNCIKGSACPWARGKRRERSGSGNDLVQRSSEPSPNTVK